MKTSVESPRKRDHELRSAGERFRVNLSRSVSRTAARSPFGRGLLLLGLLARGSLRGLRLRHAHLMVQGVGLSLSDAVHGEQVNLQVLLGLELLAAHVTRDVLGLHGVHVNDVLLQVGIVRVDLAAFGTLGFTVGVIHLLVIPPVGLEHRHALDLILRARLQHQIQLIGALGGGALLEILEIVLQFLMHHRELLAV